MAERRMFSRKLLGSSKYVTMSFPAQALYLQLCMQADDDGVVDNAVPQCRLLGCDIGHLNEQRQGGWLIELGDDLHLIAHWLVHNKIRKDRYVRTTYMTQLGTVYINADRVYTFDQDSMDASPLLDQVKQRHEEVVYTKNDNQNDNPGKESKDKVSKDKERGGEVRKDKGMRGREAARPAEHASREYPPAQNLSFFKNTDENQSDTKAIGGVKPLITLADLSRPTDTVLRGKIDHNEYP